MFFAGIVISAVAMFLGIITKLPQGGGGLANNLMIFGFFLPAPPLPPLPPRNTNLFDLETAIAENQMYYVRNPVVISNGTQGPIPRPVRVLPSATGSSDAPAQNASFKFPAFAFPEFSIPVELTQFWGSIGTTIMVFMALCLPWLVTKKMSLLGKAGTARQAASKRVFAGFGGLVAQIEPLDPLLKNLDILVSERDQAFADFWSIIKQAWDAEDKAAEMEVKKEAERKGLCAERNSALAKLEVEREKMATLEAERAREVERLRGETSSQMKAWAEKEKKWEDKKTDDKKRHVETLDSLNMGREREAESWRKKVEELEEERKGTKEASGARLKNIVERMKREREGWAKQEEVWKEEKEAEVREMEETARETRELEEKREGEKKDRAEASDRAQRRIADLEEEAQNLKEAAAERQKKGDEDEAARKTAEAEKEREQKCSEEREQGEAKRAIAKLEEEVLNGRKLIEDLQADKRRDRQLLLELRAQLVRPTHTAPPAHMNRLRFGGGNAPPFFGPPPPAMPGHSPFPYPNHGPPPQFSNMNPPSSSSSSSGFFRPQPPPATPFSPAQPFVRFPHPSPPPNAPQGPRSGT